MGLRADFLRHQLASGRPVRPDTASVVVRAGTWLTGRPPERWGAEDLLAMAWYGVVAWCRAESVEVPADAPSALYELTGYLDPDGSAGLRAAVDEIVDPVGLAARARSVRPA